MLDFLWELSIGPMLALAIASALVLGTVVLLAVRGLVRFSGFDPRVPLPINNNMISASAAMFALMLAFSAASVWNDTLQARSAVQREANALENAMSLASSLVESDRDIVRSNIVSYAQNVIRRDWPAMALAADLDDPAYMDSDRVLVHLIDHLAAETARGPPGLTPVLLGQLIEARNARLARLTLAASGISPAQWLALLVLVACVLVVVAVVHNHHRGMQMLSMGLYSIAAAAAFFAILAHDRPFLGQLSVGPGPILQIANR